MSFGQVRFDTEGFLKFFPCPLEVTLFGESNRQVITSLHVGRIDAQGKTIVSYRLFDVSLPRKYLPQMVRGAGDLRGQDA